MRKIIGLFLLLLLLFLLGSVFMPIQLEIKKEILIDNNKSVVYNKIQDIRTLQEWIKVSHRDKSNEESKDIYWEIDGVTYLCSIEEREPKNKVTLIVEEIESKKEIRVSFVLQELADKATRVMLQVNYPKTLAPGTRYYYRFNKAKVEQLYESFLNYLKAESEKVHYERFRLSSAELLNKEEIVFAIVHQSTPQDILAEKTEKVDSLLLTRLYRYKLLDSVYDKYIQYTDWSDSVVAYDVCIPLLKNPTAKQLLWLQGGKVNFLKGRFYAATYEGASHDLPLGWDSLYQRLSKTENVAEGFPLEQLLEKTDSTEVRKLFIRLR